MNSGPARGSLRKDNLLVSARNLVKSYQQGPDALQILKGIDLDVAPGETVAIVGASGSGKSTLLHILGILDRPTSGQLYISNRDVLSLSESQLAKYRNERMGFVFQFHHLLAEFTALENVSLPLRISGTNKESAQRRSQELLELVGLTSRRHHFPNQMSGGELQRVALARALVQQPELLLADEPTGNLDSKNAALIQQLILSLTAAKNMGVVVVTHDPVFAQKFSRVLRLVDGKWESGFDPRSLLTGR